MRTACSEHVASYQQHSTLGGKDTLGLPCLMNVASLAAWDGLPYDLSWWAFCFLLCFWAGTDIRRIWSIQRGIREEESSTFLQENSVQAFLKNFLSCKVGKNWNMQKMSELRCNYFFFIFPTAIIFNSTLKVGLISVEHTYSRVIGILS